MRKNLLTLLACALFVTLQINAQRLDDVPAQVENPLSPTPVMANGKFHLIYELHITNFRSASLSLSRYGDAANSPLASYKDNELTGMIARPGASQAAGDKRLISGGMRAVIFLELLIDPSGHIPMELRHRLVFNA